ncbi:transcriptional regulator [Aliishimia ponticola]|uniref:Transcriptional regulator n=1 Tax=Aliishimia ponticola TaxID=2499833 RepID=A0A4S4N9Y5_9RHOB|nr:metalloregulator ArsR/SmtB family transcription factor [Aliishimia ponticola]THH36076.1 transcriptional regulator [Aliishimia ponticola]
MANQLDSIFSALSDPTRRAVVEALTKGPATVGDLHAAHDIALPTFMRHLGVLERSGLVQSEKKGRVRVVHIEAAPLAVIEDWLTRHKAMWEARLDRLEQLATQLEASGDPPPPEKGTDT